MKFPSPMHFRDDEIAIPEGFTVKDLGWTLLTWDVVDYNAPTPRFAQFIVAPGVYLSRGGRADAFVWENKTFDVPPNVLLQTSDSRRPSVVKRAMTETMECLEFGYQWQSKPRAFTMNPDDYPLWPAERAIDRDDYSSPLVPVETVGDALLATSPAVVRDVFNASLEARAKNLRKRRR